MLFLIYPKTSPMLYSMVLGLTFPPQTEHMDTDIAKRPKLMRMNMYLYIPMIQK